MADTKNLIVPFALAAAGFASTPLPPDVAPKVLRVVARVEGPSERAGADGAASPVAVTSRGLANVIHIIGGAG